ncbi:MAG: hypothetical protein HYR60_17210 [Acidobacteria bacterium]|nr:hypothetical protein [Acidobacteriota bacterium]MBI3473980.1 hypothetical protein [Candidatus Solibacter usitatus]
MKAAVSLAAAPDPGGIQAAIERFLRTSRQPSILEPGDPLLDLTADNYALTLQGGRLTLQAWTETRNLVRQVTGIGIERRGRLELMVEHFARRPGRLWLVDRAAPGSEQVERRGDRLVFRERFRRFLSRQYPGWKLVELSTEADLEHTLSPAYPRAFLRRGQAGLAAIAVAAGADPTGALAFGLIWLDYLRRRERRLAVDRLVLLLPAGSEAHTCHRLRFLDPARAACELFAYSPENDYAVRRDPNEYTNLDTRLDPVRQTPGEARAWADRIAGSGAIEQVEMIDGTISLRVRGLEFARTTGQELLFGLHQRAAAREYNLGEVERLAAELARLRPASGGDRAHPLCARSPEAWLESAVRAQIEIVDPSLRAAPLYSQAPACAGGARGILDLLAVDRAGRLAVVEVKASSDLHLPLQALDYWMRVKWHLDRGEFTARGYFPRIELRPEPPRLLLVSPALDFHPTTETLLQCISDQVEVERIGVNTPWREGLQVMFRLRGAARP